MAAVSASITVAPPARTPNIREDLVAAPTAVVSGRCKTRRCRQCDASKEGIMLTTRFVTGAPNWIDLGTPDIDGATSFYGGLFGWQFQSAGPDSGGYGFFQLAGKTAAGGMQTTPEQGPPSWTVYFQTPDAESTAKAAEHAKGSVLMQPMDVMDEGRMAILGDEAGVPFGIWQPGRLKGIEVAGDPGSLTWVELYTRDIPAAAAFYYTVFGWETAAIPFPG